MKRLRQVLVVLVALIPLAVAGGWSAAPRELRTLVSFVVWKRLPWHAPVQQDLPVRGITIHSEIYGDGEPVLVLHGGLGMIEVMGNQIRTLAPARRVVAIDSRAHGRSTDGEGPLTYDAMAEDASEVLKALAIPRAQVVGWSDGANTALLLAIHHPDQVASVVAISPNASPDAVTPEAVAEFESEMTLDSPTGQQLRRVYEAMNPHPEHFPAFFEKFLWMAHNEPHITADQLGTLTAPTLIVGGEHDIMPDAHFRWIADAIPGAEVRITRGTTHMQPMDDPDQVDEAIIGWLDSHPMR